MDGLYTTESHQGHLQAVSGIEGLRVSVADVESAAADFGMTRRDLTLFVHGMLRLAGVPVVVADDAPTLHTTLAVRKVVDLYSVTISVELWDRVWLTRQTHGHALQAATWRRSASLVSNRHELRDNTRMELGNLLTGFLNDYVAANRTDGRAAG
jgi:hypothetical protein